MDGVDFYASGSIGISLFPQDALDGDTLLRNADSAMYRSKKMEPGGYTVFASAHREDPLERLSMTSRLRRAVEEEHWVLHYQPVVDLSDGHIVGVEALVRWQDPNGGLVAPGEFIPLAEELGLIEAIGDWVIDEMAHQQAAWTCRRARPGGVVQPLAPADVVGAARREGARQDQRRRRWIPARSSWRSPSRRRWPIPIARRRS